MTRTAVVDTNTVISRLLAWTGPASQAFQSIRDTHDLLVSEDTLAELQEVLLRPKFDRIPLAVRVAFIEEYEDATTLIRPEMQIRACRDPKDDKFLSLAVAGDAEILLTRDQDLLELDPFRGIRILTPAQYLERLATPPLR